MNSFVLGRRLLGIFRLWADDSLALTCALAVFISPAIGFAQIEMPDENRVNVHVLDDDGASEATELIEDLVGKVVLKELRRLPLAEHLNLSSQVFVMASVIVEKSPMLIQVTYFSTAVGKPRPLDMLFLTEVSDSYHTDFVSAVDGRLFKYESLGEFSKNTQLELPALKVYAELFGFMKDPNGLIGGILAQESSVSAADLERLLFRSSHGFDLRGLGSSVARGAVGALISKLTDREKLEMIYRRWSTSYLSKTKLLFEDQSFQDLLQDENISLKDLGLDDRRLTALVLAVNELPKGFRDILTRQPLAALHLRAVPGETTKLDGGAAIVSGSYNPWRKVITLYSGEPVTPVRAFFETLVHEFAHHIDFVLPRKARKKYQSYGWQSFLFISRRKTDEGFATGYSKTHKFEDFADSLEEYLLNSANLEAHSPERVQFFERLELCGAMDRVKTCF